jgi:hypothetical protein
MSKKFLKRAEFFGSFVIYNHNKLIHTMRERKDIISLAFMDYTCYDGEIDQDLLDQAVERLTKSGTWVNNQTSYVFSKEIARYIGEARCIGPVACGTIICDVENGNFKFNQLDAALSKKFNRQSDGTWILK